MSFKSDISFYDSHIHLSDTEYSDILSYLLESMNALNIKACSVTVDIGTSIRALKLFQSQREIIRNFVGIHPQFANRTESSVFEEIVSQNHEIIDGIGEIGLDSKYCDGQNDYSVQRKVFEQMLDIASVIKKPVSIHSRGSLDEILDDCSGRPNPYALRILTLTSQHYPHDRASTPRANARLARPVPDGDAARQGRSRSATG